MKNQKLYFSSKSKFQFFKNDFKISISIISLSNFISFFLLSVKHKYENKKTKIIVPSSKKHTQHITQTHYTQFQTTATFRNIRNVAKCKQKKIKIKMFLPFSKIQLITILNESEPLRFTSVIQL